MNIHAHRNNDTTNSVKFEMGGWGINFLKEGRRGGFWSHYTFDTLKEAQAEQKKQLADQAWRVKQKAKALKKKSTPKYGPGSAEYMWGSAFGHTFPIFKVTREFVK